MAVAAFSTCSKLVNASGLQTIKALKVQNIHEPNSAPNQLTIFFLLSRISDINGS